MHQVLAVNMYTLQVSLALLSSGEAVSGEEHDGPLTKRRRLDPAEVEMILNAKSSHEWAAREVDHVMVM